MHPAYAASLYEENIRTKAFYANFIHPELSTKPVDKVVEKPVSRPQAPNTIGLFKFCLFIRQYIKVLFLLENYYSGLDTFGNCKCL